MTKGKYITYYLYVIIISLIISPGCKKKYAPKPRGYFRIGLPEKNYKKLGPEYPYCFNYPIYAEIEKDSSRLAEKYWINIKYPDYNGIIHISYKKVNNNIGEIIEETRELAYKHTVKADAITEKMFAWPDKKVYGILYEIEGNAASSVQFFVTDSINHYLRGALYFNMQPNVDSLAPVIKFVKDDIAELLESFEWN